MCLIRAVHVGVCVPCIVCSPCVCVVRVSQAMVVSKEVVKAGSELCWDYEAISDDPKDELCSVRCQCGLLASPAVECGHTVVNYVTEIPP